MSCFNSNSPMVGMFRGTVVITKNACRRPDVIHYCNSLWRRQTIAKMPGKKSGGAPRQNNRKPGGELYAMNVPRNSKTWGCNVLVIPIFYIFFEFFRICNYTVREIITRSHPAGKQQKNKNNKKNSGL